MDDPKQHVIDSLKQATNILVTVRKNPTIDQLAACIALTLIVNEVGKHGTAVFSGQIPPMLSYLKPDKTIERNTDSLQDFIISLDKAKADKLRYKVEDTVVKIFITPYRTSLSNKDLEFGQGDFNVDVVVALGVHDQVDVDEAITAHGRILHDATVISINNDNEANKDLGSVSWVDTNVSGLSEMVFSIANSLGKDDAIDNQAATALLTGIVAETERFGNLKTTPEVMEIAAKLLIAGANQELVASAMAKPAEANNSNNGSSVTGNDSQDHDNSQDNGSSGNTNSSDNNNNSGSNDNSSNSNNGDNGGMPTLLEPMEQKNGGELDIEHLSGNTDGANNGSTEVTPYSGQSSDANSDSPLPLEGQPFEVPQSDGNNKQSGMPAIIDLPSGPSEPSNSGDKPSFDQPLLGMNPTGPVAQGPNDGQGQGHVEDQAALDYLKGRKVENGMSMRGRIEPLSDQGNYMEGLPQNNDDNSKFALKPPSLGGTLTASMTSENDTIPADAMKNQSQAAPLLTHDKLGTPPSATSEPAESLIAPLPAAPSSKPPEPASTNGNVPPKAPNATPTLADLEKQLHSAHSAKIANDKAPETPAGAMDMPKPTTPVVTLPSPLIEPLDSSRPASLSTPPPVPPPLPSMPA